MYILGNIFYYSLMDLYFLHFLLITNEIKQHKRSQSRFNDHISPISFVFLVFGL